MKIEKGNIYECIKTVVMSDGAIAYIKGKRYNSEYDDCITDEDGDEKHQWPEYPDENETNDEYFAEFFSKTGSKDYFETFDCYRGKVFFKFKDITFDVRYREDTGYEWHVAYIFSFDDGWASQDLKDTRGQIIEFDSLEDILKVLKRKGNMDLFEKFILVQSIDN